MPTVLVDQDVHPTERFRDGLGENFDVTVGIDDSETVGVVDPEVVAVTSRVPITRDVLADTSRLRIVAKLGTGIDTVDLEAARDEGVAVTYTPGVNATSVAEHALCLLLATARRLPRGRALIDEGRWRDEMPLGVQLTDRTVGVVGFGNVGRRFASLVDGFDATVLAHDPNVHELEAEPFGVRMTSLADVLSRCDAVVIAAERTDETEGMIGARELTRMKDSAILVNVARGEIVDEIALVEALRNERIAGAGLDVFDDEPLPSDSPLRNLDNAVLTPHVAALTETARAGTVDRLAANVAALVDGSRPADRFLAVEPS